MKPSSRQLAAIVFADIVGYTTLMEEAEANAMKILHRFEEVTKEKVAQHNGEIIKKYGDGSLMIFNSTVDAVLCAQEMQVAFREQPMVPLRIGLHVGELIKKDNDVFGHGVNIASRIESMGIPGAVILSRNAYEKIKNQSDYKTELLGSFHFQNVDEPMEVYALANEDFPIPKKGDLKGKFETNKNRKNNLILYGAGILALIFAGMFFYTQFASGDITKNSITQSSLSSKKNSIAVMPFDNMSVGEENQYFADGMHDDLLTYLSKSKDLKVISRTSVTQLKNSNKSIKEIAGLLNVSHIMEGSVRRAGDQVRINVQLIEAATDDHLWAEIYDLEFSPQNVFNIQTEIAKKISTQLTQSIFSNSPVEETVRYTENSTAYENYLRARQLKETGNRESLYQAKALLEEALTLDPDFAEAITLLGNLHIHLVYYGGEDPDVFFPKSWELMEQSMSIDPDFSETYILKGSLYHWWKRDIAGARTAYNKAILLNPNSADALYGLAIAIQDLDLNFTEVSNLLDKAISINPLNPNLMNINGIYKREHKQNREALKIFRKGVEIAPTHPTLWSNYAGTYYYLSRIDSVAILSDLCVEQNGRSGQYLRYYLGSLANFSMLNELEKETELLPGDSEPDIAIKLIFKRDLHLQRREHKLAMQTSQRINKYNLSWVNTDLYKFENYYFNREYKEAVRIYESVHPSLMQSENFNSFSNSEINYALNYVYSLLKTGHTEKANRLRDLLKPIVFDDTDISNERIQSQWFRLYLKSFILQLEGKTDEAMSLMESYFEDGNFYNMRWPKLDPIFDNARETPSYKNLFSKYDGIVAKQQNNFKNYLASK